MYDEQGKPFTLSYDNGSGVLSHYYYYVSYQGDVLGLLTTEGELAATYLYDAWGNLLEDELTLIGSLNPIRYRSYYYDSDLSLYYLQSRYYDSTTGRFISTDSTDYLDPSHLQGMNLYQYCYNNPIMNEDPTGHFVITLSMILTGLIVGALIGGGIGFLVTAYQDYVDDGTLFNDSVGWDAYLGYTLGGAIAGAGLGLTGVLGAAAGTAALVGSSTTLLSAGGMSITFGSAMLIGTCTAFVTGMVGYAVRAGINTQESFNVGTMLMEGVMNAVSGALSVAGGYLVGVTGLRADYVSKLFAKPSDIFLRPIVQNYFIFGLKLGLSLLKTQVFNG